MSVDIPARFALLNESNVKNIVIVLKIDGVPDILASARVGTRIRYGDGINYGELDEDGNPFLYGGLRTWTGPDGGTVKQLLNLEGSNLTIQQKLEPEQGRASITQLGMAFIDKDSYMTRLCSPGIVVPEILGRKVTVYLGYREISYPEDYTVVFRGRIQGVTTKPGVISLQLGDPNLIRRGQVFYCAVTQLTSAINNSTTTIPVAANGDFFLPILGPDGTDDPDVHVYLKIEDEIIEYTRTGFGSNTFTSVTRGARGTTAVAHDDNSNVQAAIEIGGNCMDIALKIMLSGHDGPFQSDVTIRGINFTGDIVFGTIPNTITFPDDVDVKRDFGLTIGDWVTISGATNPGNDQTLQITDIAQLSDGQYRLVYLDGTLTTETTTPAVAAFRSQYDTLPVLCGRIMVPTEVDVPAHQELKQQFLSQSELDFFITETEDNAKDFIEKEIYLPVSAYSLTREGRLSVKMTLPPIAGQQLIVLDHNDVIRPEMISQSRSTTNDRKFWNEIQYEFDPTDDGFFTKQFNAVDADALALVGVSSILPITSRGIRALNTSESILISRSQRLLARYSRAAVVISMDVTFGAVNTMEPGDIIVLKDEGNLQIPNFATGERDMGVALFEILDRKIDMRQGRGSIQIIGGVNFTLQDIFATVSPSSKIIVSGTTSSHIRIQPSYGSFFGTKEFKKWTDYIGCRVQVHNYNYTQVSESVLVSVGEDNTLNVSPAFSFTPDASHVFELANYSTSTDPTVDAIAKIVHVSIGRTAPITSGVSPTQFNVGVSDEPYFLPDYPLEVRKNDWSVMNSDAVIQSIVGTLVTTVESLGFTPDNTYVAELLAWDDGRGPYRLV